MIGQARVGDEPGRGADDVVGLLGATPAVPSAVAAARTSSVPKRTHAAAVDDDRLGDPPARRRASVTIGQPGGPSASRCRCCQPAAPTAPARRTGRRTPRSGRPRAPPPPGAGPSPAWRSPPRPRPSRPGGRRARTRPDRRRPGRPHLLLRRIGRGAASVSAPARTYRWPARSRSPPRCCRPTSPASARRSWRWPRPVSTSSSGTSWTASSCPTSRSARTSSPAPVVSSTCRSRRTSWS